MEQRLQAKRFIEMLQEEFEIKVKNSNNIVDKLQTKNISYRYVTSDDGDAPQILVNEMFFGDEISMTVEFRSRNIMLVLKRINTKTYNVVQTVKMQSEDAERIVSQIEALTLIYKIGYKEGRGLE